MAVPPRRGQRAWVLGAAVTLVSSGCGMRVPFDPLAVAEVRSGADVPTAGLPAAAGFTAATPGPGTSAGGEDPVAAGSLPSSPAGSVRATAPGRAAEAGPARSGPTGSGGGAAAQPGDSGPAPAAGTATPPAGVPGAGEGVAVTIGGLAIMSGPAAAVLAGPKAAYDMWMGDVNRRGGVHGRRLRVVWADTGGAAGRNASAARDLVENDKALALVELDPLGASGSNRYLQERGVPVVGGDSASNVWFQTPVMFPIGNQYNGTAMLGYWAATTGKATKAAVLSLNVAVSQEGCATTAHQLEQHGVEVVYEASVPFGTPDMTVYVVEARRRGADAVLNCLDTGTTISLLRAEQAQGFKPYNATASGSSDEALLKAAPADVLEGMEVNFPTASYVDRAVPGIREYWDVFDRSGVRFTHGSLSVRGYAAAKLLTTALGAIGPEFDRQRLLEWLNRQDNITLDGVLPPDTSYRPNPDGTHRESNCSQMWRVTGGAWAPASNGWSCLDTS